MSRLKKRQSIIEKLAEKGEGKRGAPVKRIKPYTAKTFKVDNDLLRALKELAEREKMTVTELLHKALWQYVNTKKK